MTTAEYSSSALPPRRHRAVGLWLLGISALLFCMVVLGGVTRLTDSGLSITEWRPVTGVIPPLSAADWQAELEKYRQIPEYRQINEGMGMPAFQRIYLYEWSHRLLGRLIGLAFLIPFLVFLWRRWVDRPLALRLAGIFVLGGLQGALGWYMVKSGLTVRTDVSQYRLTAHLGMAFAIQAAVIWTAFGQFGAASGKPSSGTASRRLGLWALGFAALVYVQVLLGGFVAGLDAGMIYNTWPLMGGSLVPGDLVVGGSWWHSLFENPTLVQFNHRLGAYGVTAAAIVLWLAIRRAPVATRSRRAADWLLLALCCQMVLGIATLMLVVPMSLAAAHQAGAFILFTLALRTAYVLLTDATAPAASA
jgi:cytochrome c oxidase assembly protein subunit 15